MPVCQYGFGEPHEAGVTVSCDWCATLEQTVWIGSPSVAMGLSRGKTSPCDLLDVKRSDVIPAVHLSEGPPLGIPLCRGARARAREQ